MSRRPARGAGRRTGERGAASVLMIAVAVVGLVLALGAARVGGAVVARARADTAADAAALAAADLLALGRDAAAAEAAAATTARANGARLVTCRCDDDRPEVVVEVPTPALVPFGRVARAVARAEVRPDCGRGCSP